MNSPSAIVRRASITIVTLAGFYAFYHSVKKTTNWNVLIMPQRSFSDEPRMMLIIVFAVITELELAIAPPTAPSIAAAIPLSIYLGRGMTRGSPSLTTKSLIGSLK